jgi:hypothetical protein
VDKLGLGEIIELVARVLKELSNRRVGASGHGLIEVLPQRGQQMVASLVWPRSADHEASRVEFVCRPLTTGLQTVLRDFREGSGCRGALPLKN